MPKQDFPEYKHDKPGEKNEESHGHERGETKAQERAEDKAEKLPSAYHKGR